jgi:hypothetical protein
MSIRATPRIQSFSTDRLIFISRVSFNRSVECENISRAASEPARSTRYRIPPSAGSCDGLSIRMRHIACDREEPSFLIVGADCRSSFAFWDRASSSAVLRMLNS